MPIPIIGWAAIIVVSFVAGLSIYQIRLSVKDVTEVFTAKDSVLNSGYIQIGIAAIGLFIAIKSMKG